MASILLNRGRCNFPCCLPMAAHPGADDGYIIPDFWAKVKASTRCRFGDGRDPLSEGCQELGDPISHLLLASVQEVIGAGEYTERLGFGNPVVQFS